MPNCYDILESQTDGLTPTEITQLQTDFVAEFGEHFEITQGSIKKVVKWFLNLLREQAIPS